MAIPMDRHTGHLPIITTHTIRADISLPHLRIRQVIMAITRVLYIHMRRRLPDDHTDHLLSIRKDMRMTEGALGRHLRMTTPARICRPGAARLRHFRHTTTRIHRRMNTLGTIQTRLRASMAARHRISGIRDTRHRHIIVRNMVETEVLVSIFRIFGPLAMTGNLSPRADTEIENIVERGLVIIRKRQALHNHDMDTRSPHQAGRLHRNDEAVKRDVGMDSMEV